MPTSTRIRHKLQDTIFVLAGSRVEGLLVASRFQNVPKPFAWRPAFNIGISKIPLEPKIAHESGIVDSNMREQVFGSGLDRHAQARMHADELNPCTVALQALEELTDMLLVNAFHVSPNIWRSGILQHRRFEKSHASLCERLQPSPTNCGTMERLVCARTLCVCTCPCARTRVHAGVRARPHARVHTCVLAANGAESRTYQCSVCVYTSGTSFQSLERPHQPCQHHACVSYLSHHNISHMNQDTAR